MFWSRIKPHFYVFAALGILFLDGCIGLEKPGVKDQNRMNAIFVHTGKETNCASCHEKNRPAPKAGVPHGNGGDCISCHTSNAPWTSILPTSFNHVPTPTSCISCHASARPKTVIQNFDHSINGMGDCVTCHAQGAGVTWAGGTTYPSTLSAYTQPAQGATDHSVLTYQPTWGGVQNTTITAITQVTQVIPQTMNHHSLNVSPSQLQSCTTCHSDAGAGEYKPGYYHVSIGLTQPSTCIECHGSGILSNTGTITNGMPTGFVGSVLGNARTPATPEMNHYAKDKASNAIVTQDCTVCHKNPGDTWVGANFHTSLASANIAQPAACLDCHANNRPSGLVPASPSVNAPTQFNHTTAPGDCVSCHAAPVSTNTSSPPAAALWANGIYHASAGPQTSCSSCHNSQRPTSTSGWIAPNSNAPFDYAKHGNGMDCVSCHNKASPDYTTMNGWTGGHYTHSTTGTTTCIGCHSAPTTAWYPTAGSISYTHSPGVDCIGCHKQALTNVISQGANPKISAWVNTGQNGVPSGPVGNKTLNVTTSSLASSANPILSVNQVTGVSNSTSTLILNMDHSSSAIPAMHKSGTALTCTNCHTNASQGVYSNALFHTNPATNTLWSQQPTSCKDCHNSAVPSGIAGTTLRYLNHATLLSNGQTVLASANDCATCHTKVGVSGGWRTSGSFHGKITSATPKSCTECHYPDVSAIKSTVTNKMVHTFSQVTQDCASCHAQPTATQITTAGYPTAALWSGGKYHASISAQPTSCTSCHSGQKPTTTTMSSIGSSSPTASYMNHASSFATSDCATCHSETKNLPAGTAPTAWSKSISFHTAVASGVSSCKGCHGTTNGITANSIPASVSFGTKASSIGNVGSRITPQFNSPASGSPVYVAVNHKDTEVTSRDCITCHSVPAANAGPSYSKWRAGTMHASIGKVSTGKCVNCHYNLMPNDTYTAFKHVTNLVTTTASGNIAVPNNAGSYIKQDCGACHGANEGKNWTGASSASPHNANFLKTASCVSCHAASGGPTTYSPGAAVGMPAGAVNLTAAGYKVTFYHISPTTVTRASGSGTVTLKGSYNLSQTACVYCHGAAAKAIEVPATSSSTIKAAPTGTGWSAGTMGPSKSIGYHKLNPTSYTYTSGSGITSASGGSNPATCAACHEDRRRAKSANHEAGKDCAGCHSVNGW